MATISKRSRSASGKSTNRANAKKPDYVLQDTAFDLPLYEVLSFSERKRTEYVQGLVEALRKLLKKDEVALKRRTSFKTEMRDLRKLFYSPADQYLYVEDGKQRRWVLGKGSPGSTHVYWSRNHIWKMKTKKGALEEELRTKSPSLVKRICRFLDPQNEGMSAFRNEQKSVIENILKFLEYDKRSGCAFPPFHAKFFADRFLPKAEGSIVLDPCAGWGGRLIGSLLVNRSEKVTYIGIDPEERNKAAYEGLTRRATVWLKKEIAAEREALIFYEPFEDWVDSAGGRRFFGKVDLVITSPPYFGAEVYNDSNSKQSTSRYDEYTLWRNRFYEPLIHGAYNLLKKGGVFVLNVADVAEAPRLERDANELAKRVGFERHGFFKLAMALSPTARHEGKTKQTLSVRGKRFRYEPVFVFRK